MIRNITITEFELMITGRVLCDRLVDRPSGSLRDSFTLEELLTQGVFAANDILKETGANQDVWIRLRGKRAFMFHERSRRIVAEMSVVSDVAGQDMLRRPRYVLLGKRGLLKAPSIGDLIVRAESAPAQNHGSFVGVSIKIGKEQDMGEIIKVKRNSEGRLVANLYGKVFDLAEIADTGEKREFRAFGRVYQFEVVEDLRGAGKAADVELASEDELPVDELEEAEG